MVKIGDRIKVIANTNSHNYRIGQEYKVVNIQPPYIQAITIDGTFRGNNLADSDFEFVSLNECDINSRIADLEDEIQKWKDIQEYLKESGNPEYDPIEYMIYNSLKEIEKDSSLALKAKAIKRIIQNK